MNMSEAVSKVLKGSGVNYLFGIPGGGSSADLMNAPAVKKRRGNLTG